MRKIRTNDKYGQFSIIIREIVLKLKMSIALTIKKVRNVKIKQMNN